MLFGMRASVPKKSKNESEDEVLDFTKVPLLPLFSNYYDLWLVPFEFCAARFLRRSSRCNMEPNCVLEISSQEVEIDLVGLYNYAKVVPLRDLSPGEELIIADELRVSN